MFPRREFFLLATALALSACGGRNYRKVIVIGVDGMDPGFVERHWADLPNLTLLRQQGSYSRLETTDPPQSPVAWSTFITGLDPGEHGIFDFVHRDPVTREPYLSTDKTIEPRFTLPVGPWVLPLSRSHVISLRKGRAFWEYLSDAGIPVTIIRIPANYPPSKAGREIAGMGAPDLRGTQGTFSYYTDDPSESSREVSGGLIRKVSVDAGHVDLRMEGPPNTLRRDRAYAAVTLSADIDPEQPYARLQIGSERAIVREGEWSDWLTADFPLLPHFVSVRGMFRVFAKQLHPRFELYVSPVNVDPDDPALPISSPESYGREFGRWSTLGIPEDTSALRQGVFDLPQFLSQSHLGLDDERRLLDESLGRFRGGLLFFYFSAVDQNSHVLWGRHEAELLEVYRAVDASIGEVIRRQPDAELVVMSDHGFAAFDRAVNLNTLLASRGFGKKAWALGLNGLYLMDQGVRAEVKQELLEFRDPVNGRQVIESVKETHPSAVNRSIAPDLIVGYSAGYRASWETALGEAPGGVLEDNNDAWIADHCIDPKEVPAVLFANRPLRASEPKLKDLPVSLLALFGVARPSQMSGRAVF
ncbi:MAG TPA: alkaline phosphatase family protein [Bryobacteraceae bacterium]|nr:alkaline phosphatase family protein [Bryobacteraceae bacterium]